jgi:DNA-binding response OmpR family regulator
MAKTEKAIILIVEDNPLTLQTLIEYLKKLDLKMLVARSGEEALRRIQSDKPNLILLDVLLPGINGFETCRRLKSNISTREIPVIFLTALSEMADKVKGFEVGGVDYITKPFDFKEVAARINTRLTIQRLQRRLKARNTGLTSGKKTPESGEKVTILIVDDNVMTLQVMMGYLKGLGYHTVGAQSGEEALKCAEASPPDLILLDVLMLGLDGFETCHRLKSNLVTKEIPVIFMTALTEMSDKVKAFEAGGVDYITKPHHYAEIVARVSAHLTIRTLQKQLQKES